MRGRILSPSPRYLQYIFLKINEFVRFKCKSGVQEGLELPEDEEEKKKTEADKEKFGGLCKVFIFLTTSVELKFYGIHWIDFP